MMIRTLSAAIALFVPLAADAAVLRVGTGQSYQTVQAAVSDAANFDTIVVHAGTYVGNVSVPARFTHLSIKANGTDAVTIRAGQNDLSALSSDSTHLRLKGLRLEASAGETRQVLSVTNSAGANVGYFATILCDNDLVGNTSNTDVAVRAQNSALAKLGAVYHSATFTGLSATSSGPVTNIWEDDMPYGIWEDDMPLGIWEDDMPYGIWPNGTPVNLCLF